MRIDGLWPAEGKGWPPPIDFGHCSLFFVCCGGCGVSPGLFWLGILVNITCPNSSQALTGFKCLHIFDGAYHTCNPPYCTFVPYLTYSSSLTPSNATPIAVSSPFRKCVSNNPQLHLLHLQCRPLQSYPAVQRPWIIHVEGWKQRLMTKQGCQPTSTKQGRRLWQRVDGSQCVAPPPTLLVGQW